MMHKPTASSWVKPTNTFTPAPELGRPPGGSSPVIHFFHDEATGARWIGKLGQVPLRDRKVLEAARRLPGFLGVYADEILEKLGLAVYQLLGTEVPESALSYQQVTIEAMHQDMLLAMQLNAEDEGRVFELPHSPRMHYMSRYVDEFQPLDKDFVEHYLANAKRCGNEYVKIQTRDGKMLPLRGLGSMLAAADFVYDLDCLGDSCGNAGYVIKEDAATGERYAQLVKIDAGYAFSYSDLRTDQRDNPRDRQIRVAPNQLRLQFADLAPADQKEFAAAAKQILATPYEEFAHLFSQTQELKEGLSVHHCQQLLDELIARKSLFLKAFAPETDRSIVKEIEAAQAKVAKKLEHTEEVSSQAIEEMLGQEKEEAVALAELRVRLAVVDVKESELEKVGECKTFQLPSTNTHFVGREEALAEVLAQLNRASGSVIGQSISGIGGVGKTQLALHYAQAAANGEAVCGQYLGYDYVVWLNAELFLEGQFQAMAELWTGEQLKADEAIEAVYRHLRGKRTLLIFDNAENARSIAAFLPPTDYASPVHFLITSRSAEWGGLPTVKLGGFSLEEAQEYVEHHLGPQSKEAVAKLVELLGGLPLAMSQAVSYIKAGHSTLEGFEEQFYLNQANLLSHELLDEEDHPKTVGTTLTLSLAQAKARNPIVEKLLGTVAYLSPESIQLELLMQSLESSKEEVLLGLEVLASYSLVSCEAIRGHVQVHRLVQEVMRHRHKFLSEPTSYLEKVVVILREVVTFDQMDMEAMRSCGYAIAHVLQVAKIAKGHNLSKEQELSLALLLETSGLHQHVMGNYGVARDCQQQVLEIRERHCDADSLGMGNVLMNLGLAYSRLGDPEKELELLERALTIFEEHSKFDDLEAVRSLGGILSNLAGAYTALGNPRKAQELLERALAIAKKCYGNDHPEVAGKLMNLGVVYGILGEVIKQKELLERVLAIYKQYYGPDHPKVASALVNLSNVYSDQGKPREQMQLLKRAFEIQEKHYGPDHPELAIVLRNLGNAYGALDKPAKQKKLLERALRIEEAYYGSDHVKVAETVMNLGAVYGNLGFPKKKQLLSERALSIQEAYYGPDHFKLAITLVNLGNAYGDLGDPHKQKELLERALRLQEEHYGPNHLEVGITLDNLGYAYRALGDVDGEKAVLERALSIQEQHYGREHVALTATVFSLCDVYLGLESFEEAKELMERALIIHTKRFGPNHVLVGGVLSNLSSVCFALGQYSEAAAYAVKANSIFEECYEKGHPLIMKNRELLRACQDLERSVPSFADALRGVGGLGVHVSVVGSRRGYQDLNGGRYGAGSRVSETEYRRLLFPDEQEEKSFCEKCVVS